MTGPIPCPFYNNYAVRQTELRKARQVEQGRLKVAPKPTGLTLEIAKEGEGGGSALLIEKNRRLVEEVLSLRTQLDTMSKSRNRQTILLDLPGDSADGRRPSPHGSARDAENTFNNKRAEDNSAAVISTELPKKAKGEDRILPIMVAPSSRAETAPNLEKGTGSSETYSFDFREGKRPVAPAAALAGLTPTPIVSAQKKEDAPGDLVAYEGGRSVCVGGEDSVERMVEAETARILTELRANPPASTRALLLAREELDACAAASMARLNASSLLLRR